MSLIRVKDLCIGDLITWDGCKAKITSAPRKSWGYWHIGAELWPMGPVEPFPSDWPVNKKPWITEMRFNDNDVIDYVVRAGKVIQDTRLECPECKQKCHRQEYGGQVFAFCPEHEKFEMNLDNTV